MLAGASERCEERLVTSTNYWPEAIHALPAGLSLRLCLAGPEVSKKAHNTERTLLEPSGQRGGLRVVCFRGTTADFLATTKNGKGKVADAARSVSMVFGYNMGYGSGRRLLQSWGPDLLAFVRSGWPCVFTCANDYSDLKGETAVMREALQAKFVMPPQQNPFRAVTTVHAPGRKDDTWSCANNYVYCVCGFEDDAKAPQSEQALARRLEELSDRVALPLQPET